MDEREREVVREDPVVERNRTTVINTGERSGGGGLLAAVLLLVVLAVVAFLVFGDRLGVGDKTDIKVDVQAPDVDLPDVNLSAPGNQTK